METNAINTKNRLKKLIVCDKKMPSALSSLLKRDIEKILLHYMQLTKESVFVNHNIDERGCYHFNISFKAERIKNLGLYQP